MAGRGLGTGAGMIWLAVAAVSLALICVVIYLMVDGEATPARGSAGPLTQSGSSTGSHSSASR